MGDIRGDAPSPNIGGTCPPCPIGIDAPDCVGLLVGSLAAEDDSQAATCSQRSWLVRRAASKNSGLDFHGDRSSSIRDPRLRNFRQNSISAKQNKTRFAAQRRLHPLDAPRKPRPPTLNPSHVKLSQVLHFPLSDRRRHPYTDGPPRKIFQRRRQIRWGMGNRYLTPPAD